MERLAGGSCDPPALGESRAELGIVEAKEAEAVEDAGLFGDRHEASVEERLFVGAQQASPDQGSEESAIVVRCSHRRARSTAAAVGDDEVVELVDVDSWVAFDLDLGIEAEEVFWQADQVRAGGDQVLARNQAFGIGRLGKRAKREGSQGTGDCDTEEPVVGEARDPLGDDPHDGSYRRLFSHARMVRDLIERYVAPPWVERLDFSTLEMVPTHYVSEELEQRESDVVWRLRYGPEGQWFYVYILIEFQSEVLRFMAVRVVTYVLLLYEDLIQKKRFTGSGKLPPVVPIVLYNGERQWAAPLQVAELVESIPGQERHVPRFEILVIDEVHLPRKSLVPLDNPVAGVFQLEQSRGVEEIRRIIDSLLEILDDPELKELRRDMATWLRRAVLPARLPGIAIPELQDLQEARTMLAERAARWPQEWMAKGYEKGREEGRRLDLIDLIEAKFGAVEPRYRQLIAEASEAQLKLWLKRVLTASSLDKIFGV